MQECVKLIKNQDGTFTRCLKPVQFSNVSRCEDCWADDQQRYSGADQSVNLIHPRDTDEDSTD